MVKLISYIVAIVLTALIALVLYPLAALFYLFSIIGKISDNLFKWANNTIKKLWNDVKESGKAVEVTAFDKGIYVCPQCGKENLKTQAFCNNCGTKKPNNCD